MKQAAHSFNGTLCAGPVISFSETESPGLNFLEGSGIDVCIAQQQQVKPSCCDRLSLWIPISFPFTVVRTRKKRYARSESVITISTHNQLRLCNMYIEAGTRTDVRLSLLVQLIQFKHHDPVLCSAHLRGCLKQTTRWSDFLSDHLKIIQHVHKMV